MNRPIRRRRLLAASAGAGSLIMLGGLGLPRKARAETVRFDLRIGASGTVTQAWHNDSKNWNNALDVAYYGGGNSVGVYLRRHSDGSSGTIEIYSIGNSCETFANPAHRAVTVGLFKLWNDVNAFGDTYLVHIEPLYWIYVGWRGSSRTVGVVGTGQTQVSGCYVCSGSGCSPSHLHQNANGDRYGTPDVPSAVTADSNAFWYWDVA